MEIINESSNDMLSSYLRHYNMLSERAPWHAFASEWRRTRV